MAWLLQSLMLVVSDISTRWFGWLPFSSFSCWLLRWMMAGSRYLYCISLVMGESTSWKPSLLRCLLEDEITIMAATKTSQMRSSISFEDWLCQFIPLFCSCRGLLKGRFVAYLTRLMGMCPMSKTVCLLMSRRSFSKLHFGFGSNPKSTKFNSTSC